MKETQFIKQSSRKVFAVIPYARFKKMQDDLDDYAA